MSEEPPIKIQNLLHEKYLEWDVKRKLGKNLKKSQ